MKEVLNLLEEHNIGKESQCNVESDKHIKTTNKKKNIIKKGGQ